MKKTKFKQIIDNAVRQLKAENINYKIYTQDDLYSIYSEIISDELEGYDEYLIEELIFEAVRRTQKGLRRHTADPLYDPDYCGFDSYSKFLKYF